MYFTTLKRYFLIILIFAGFKATASVKLDEIACFSIHNTKVDIVEELSGLHKLKIKTIKSVEDYQKLLSKKDKIGEIQINPAELPVQLKAISFQEKTRIFYIPELRHSALLFTNLYLVFENNILVAFFFDYSKMLEEQLESRNGHVKEEKMDRYINCPLTYAGGYTKEPESFMFKKWTEKTTSCMILKGELRNSKCERIRVAFIQIGDDRYLFL